MKTEKCPLVSIITPSYNQGKFIEQTILSVISQEGCFYLEYLIIDGGSVDDSVKVIKKYDQILKGNKFSFKCQRIEYKWVSEVDEGQSDAINKGFKMARGEVIGWLNSDDTYLPGTINKVIREFATCPNMSLIYGDCNFIDRENSFIKKWETGPFSKKTLSRYCPLAQPAVFFRRRILKEVGFLNPCLHFAMDHEFWVRIFKKGFRAKKTNTTLANYRLYPKCKSFVWYNSIGELLCIVFQYFTNTFPETFKTYLLRFSKEKKCALETARDYLVAEMLNSGKEKSEPFLNKNILKGYLLARLECFMLDFLIKRKGNFLDSIEILKEVPSFLVKMQIVVLFLKAFLEKGYYFMMNRLYKVSRI